MNENNELINKKSTFFGNPLLKRKNEPVELTPEHLEELKKCYEDIVYFAETYYTIVNVDTGRQKIQLYDYQKNMLKALVENRQVIFCTSRQIGKTTIVTIFLVWYILFNEDKSVACLANKLASAREILSRIQMAYSLLPKWLQQGCVEWNKSSIELENGSKLFVAATTSDSVRGKSFSCIYLDEVAFVPENLWNKFFTSTYPTISSGKETKLIMTSTPNGHNHFYNFWIRAKNNPQEMYPLEVNYYEVPGRDEEWKKKQLAIMSEEQFNCEYCNSFDIQSNTLVSPHKLLELERDIKDPIESDGHTKIYEKAIPGHTYIGSVDCADVGKDYSCISIIDITEEKYIQVAVYYNDKISYIAFPQIIMQFSRLYNDCRMLVESNNIGTAICRILISELEFENLIFSRSKTGSISGPGQLTTQKTKSIGCLTLKELLEQDKLCVYNIDTIKELKNFILHENGTYSANGGHDDLCMSLVNFCYYINTPEFNIYYGDICCRLVEDVEIMKKQEEEIKESCAPLPLFVNKYLRDERNKAYGITEERVILR